MKTSSAHIKQSRGFTLVELLIVVGMLSICMGAIYSLYVTQQRSAYTQDEVVEVQQNLRIAMENIGRDIRMAGLLIPTASALPADLTPVRSAAASVLVLNSATSEPGGIGAIAVMDILGTPPQQTGVLAPFRVDSTEVMDGFTVGDYVRVLDPQTYAGPRSGGAATNTIYRVAAKDYGVARTMTLDYESGDPAGATDFIKGDLITKIRYNTVSGIAARHPNTIRYFLENNELKRRANEDVTGAPAMGLTDTQVVATNISALDFSYILDNNTETSAPANLSMIRAVRVTVTGQTSATASLSGGAKTRAITSVLKIRNRPEP